MPKGADEWFKALPAYVTAVEVIGPLHKTALKSAEALTEAIDHHVAEVRKAAREAEDAPTPDRIYIKPEITVEPPEPCFIASMILSLRPESSSPVGGSEGGAHDECPAEREDGL
jgi:hypothetical protein